MKRLNNNKGVILISSYIFLSALITLTAGFSLSAVSELSNAQRYKNSTTAFWQAEAEINNVTKYAADLSEPITTSSFDGYGALYSVNVAQSSDGTAIEVTATGSSNGIQRQIQIEFPSMPTSIFDKNLAIGGNLRTVGASFRTSTLNVDGLTRLAGIFDDSAWNLNENFEDMLENQPASDTTLTYPDADENGTSDEYNDFVLFYQNLLATYPAEDYVYIEPADGETTIEGTVNIYPNQDWGGETLVDKKIVFINGGAAGKGDTRIWFDSTNWTDNQNLTIISTGPVHYIEPLNGFADNSKLNVISWGEDDGGDPGYKQGSVLLAYHTGTIYTHDDTHFREILSSSVTEGNVIANDSMKFEEWLRTTKTFAYIDPLAGGNVPPGFEGLGTSSGYQKTPNSWKEI